MASACDRSRSRDGIDPGGSASSVSSARSATMTAACPDKMIKVTVIEDTAYFNADGAITMNSRSASTVTAYGQGRATHLERGAS